MEVSIYRVTKRLMPLLIILFIIVSVGGFFGLSALPPQYQSTARILVERQTQDIPMLDRYQILSAVMVRNELERLKSVTLFSKAMERLGLDSRPYSKIFKDYHKKLQVKQLPSSTVIQVQAMTGSAQSAAELINVLIELLMEENRADRKLEIERTTKYIAEKIEEIRIAKQELAYGRGSAPGRAVIQPALADVMKKLSLCETEFKAEQRKIPAQDWNRVANLFDENTVLIKNYRKAIDPPLTAWAGLTQNNQNNALNIKKLQSQIWREKVKTVNQLKNVINQIPLKNYTWDKMTFSYLRVLEMRALSEKLTGARPMTADTRVISMEEKKLDSLNKMETGLIEKLTDLQVSEGLTDLEITWMDKALPPDEPYFPRLELSIPISLAVALVFCVIVVCLAAAAEESCVESGYNPNKIK